MALERTVKSGLGSGVAILAIALSASAATEQSVRYVTARVPIVGHSVEVRAVRPAAVSTSRNRSIPLRATNTWTKLATLPNATVHDVAFATATVGYAAAELGQVWKTTDGGNTWQLVLNRGFPYYYYGIAVSAQ